MGPQRAKKVREGQILSISSWAGMSISSCLWLLELLVLRLSDLDRTTPTGFRVLQFAGGRWWDFSASITMWASSRSKSLHLSNHLSASRGTPKVFTLQPFVGSAGWLLPFSKGGIDMYSLLYLKWTTNRDLLDTRIDTHVSITESLCCTPETNTTL